MKESRWIYYRNFALGMLFMLIPIRRRRFYFCSFHGQYADSPRIISESLHNIYPDAEFYWEITEKCHEQLPDYILPVKPNTIRSIYYKETCELSIENYMGAFSGYEVQGSFKYRVLSKQRRKGQLNISTWHGTPLKKIAIDEPQNIRKNLTFYSSSDYLLCNSTFLADLFKRITFGKIPLMMTGLPRNDKLFFGDERQKSELLKKLKLPDHKKVLLFAPTFRDGDIEMSGIYQISQLNIDELLRAFRKKFGGEWIFVFRAHDSVLVEIEKRTFGSNIIYSGNIGDDMADYNVVADALLTDYSGCFYDFALTKRPCFLYCPDLEHYANEERGFYFQMDELPFPCAVTADKLIDNVECFSFEEYKEKLNCFQTRIGNIDDGHGTEHVVNLIQEKLEQ